MKTADQMCLWEERPASHSPSPDSGADSPTAEGKSPSGFLTSYESSGLAGWFGRTYPASSLRITVKPLESYSERWMNAGMVWRGECWTHSISEFPSAAAASSLLDIIETGALPLKYFLSPKACAGILRRAEKRGKQLPAELYMALKSVPREDASRT